MAGESVLQKRILTWLDSQGFWTVKTIATNKRGVPDIIACSPEGLFYAIEVKAPGKLSGVTKLQQYQIDQINQNGGKAFAADNLETVKSRREEDECSN